MSNFWKNAPKIGPKQTGWRPGEIRTYMPVVSFGVPENVPDGVLVGKATGIIGTQRVSTVVHGSKAGGTNNRRP